MECLQVHPDVLKELDTQRHNQALQQAASHLMASVPSGQSDSPRSRWFAQQQIKLLHGLGHGLVRLGYWISGPDTLHPT
ncbi:MAG: hypothetical protein JXA21_26560 [Anaerolineae bacterium]|nr:hypothetical protein [Anaerolineae bacterium]